MSKYEELAILSAKWSHAFFQNQQDCQRFALGFVRSYAEYLECPLENVSFVKLDGLFKATEVSVPYGMKVPLVLDADGFWTFCVQIKFSGPDPKALAHEQLKIGVKLQDGIVTLREDQDFNVGFVSAANLLPIFERMYERSRVEFSSPVVKQSKRIGFIP